MEDSLKFHRNEDGSYTAEWNKDDPNWKWLNDLTSKELQIIIEQAIKEDSKTTGTLRHSHNS